MALSTDHRGTQSAGDGMVWRIVRPALSLALADSSHGNYGDGMGLSLQRERQVTRSPFLLLHLLLFLTLNELPLKLLLLRLILTQVLANATEVTADKANPHFKGITGRL